MLALPDEAPDGVLRPCMGGCGRQQGLLANPESTSIIQKAPCQARGF